MAPIPAGASARLALVASSRIAANGRIDRRRPVTDDGIAECWGNNESGRTTVPDGVYAKVGVGESHACGLLLGGRIACWGGNGEGQTDVPKNP